MLREKTAILAHLKKLREGVTTRTWRIVGAGLGSAVGMAAAIAVAPGMPVEPLITETVVEQLGTPSVSVSRNDQRPFIREDRIRAGESLAGALRRLGVSAGALTAQANNPKLTKELAGAFRPGALITVASTAEGGLHSASISAPGSDSAHVIEVTDGRLHANHKALALESRIHMQGGTVQSSLFAAMDAAGLPDSVAEELSRIFGDDIDFHTDLRKGDRFSVIYEVLYHQGRAIRTGKIIAAEFINQGVRHSAHLFTHPNGSQDYYNQEGKSHKEGFLRSPLEFSRVSSGFSMRLHPVFGTWREHKGVDYAAPHGTAVKATSDGTVEFVGQQNGYGNFVVLRHGDKYTTGYGHLSGFARGLKTGSRVTQGETIGYVGSTGWATGPHLHYEFRINNVHQDPLTVSLPNATALSGIALTTFRAQTTALSARLTQLQQDKTAFLD
jgi:murein DD-endopeptidase MepM/ murein hydrolase activator NlpD